MTTLEPTAYAAALTVAGTRARQSVRAGLRHLVPRCGCGRWLPVDGACGRCDPNPLAEGHFCDRCGTRLDKADRPCPMGCR